MKKYLCKFLCLFLSLLFLFYGTAVRAIGSGTSFFIVWLGLGILFLIPVLFPVSKWMKKLPSWAKAILIAILILGFGSLAVVEACVASAFSAKGSPDLDYIIVLGAQVYENGPSLVLKFRLDEAVDYLENNPDTTVIVTGGQGSNEPFPEAQGMADYLTSCGIPAERIRIENRSLTTEQNIQNSLSFIEEGASVGLITNNFHLFRALWIARNNGIPQITGISAYSTPLFLPNNMFREYFAIGKYVLRLLLGIA